MNRNELEGWLDRHPGSILTDPHSLLDRCEVEIREHAHEIAWRHASEIAEESLHRFERGFGLPASETFVAREVCHEVARELRHHAPRLEGVEEGEWLSEAILASLTSDARNRLRDWLRDVAGEEERQAWKEIVHFTDHVARALIDETGMSDALEWDFDRSYPRLARRVIERLIHDFDEHAEEAHRAAIDSSPRGA